MYLSFDAFHKFAKHDRRNQPYGRPFCLQYGPESLTPLDLPSGKRTNSSWSVVVIKGDNPLHLLVASHLDQTQFWPRPASWEILWTWDSIGALGPFSWDFQRCRPKHSASEWPHSSLMDEVGSCALHQLEVVVSASILRLSERWAFELPIFTPPASVSRIVFGFKLASALPWSRKCLIPLRTWWRSAFLNHNAGKMIQKDLPARQSQQAPSLWWHILMLVPR